VAWFEKYNFRVPPSITGTRLDRALRSAQMGAAVQVVV
jgi:hypothetical protein